MRLAWSKGRRLSCAVKYSSSEMGELTQWLCRDDNVMIAVFSLADSILTFNC